MRRERVRGCARTPMRMRGRRGSNAHFETGKLCRRRKRGDKPGEIRRRHPRARGADIPRRPRIRVLPDSRRGESASARIPARIRAVEKDLGDNSRRARRIPKYFSEARLRRIPRRPAQKGRRRTRNGGGGNKARRRRADVVFDFQVRAVAGLLRRGAVSQRRRFPGTVFPAGHAEYRARSARAGGGRRKQAVRQNRRRRFGDPFRGRRPREVRGDEKIPR